MKNWQFGFDLDYLKFIESEYKDYNEFSLSPFTKYKKNNIAKDLKEGNLHITPNSKWVETVSKVRSNITCYNDVVFAYKLPGDVTVSKLAHSERVIETRLEALRTAPTWVFYWVEDHLYDDMLIRQGFKLLGGKIVTTGEIYGVWFRNVPKFDMFGQQLPEREFPKLHETEYFNLKHFRYLSNDQLILLNAVRKNLQQLEPNFTNHYSNYNVNKSWSAISLRGYRPEWEFITKPSEMSDKWQKENAGIEFAIQDTALYDAFPEVRQLLNEMFHDNVEFHRIRFMKLSQGQGELSRHTDQVDKECGKNVGQVLRFHFPVQTNKEVIFTSWDMYGRKKNVNMWAGEVWMLDTRYPHKVINNGSEDRIHLVVDLVVTPHIQDMLCYKI